MNEEYKHKYLKYKKKYLKLNYKKIFGGGTGLLTADVDPVEKFLNEKKVEIDEISKSKLNMLEELKKNLPKFFKKEAGRDRKNELAGAKVEDWTQVLNFIILISYYKKFYPRRFNRGPLERVLISLESIPSRENKQKSGDDNPEIKIGKWLKKIVEDLEITNDLNITNEKRFLVETVQKYLVRRPDPPLSLNLEDFEKLMNSNIKMMKDIEMREIKMKEKLVLLKGQNTKEVEKPVGSVKPKKKAADAAKKGTALALAERQQQDKEPKRQAPTADKKSAAAEAKTKEKAAKADADAKAVVADPKKEAEKSDQSSVYPPVPSPSPNII
jgi:hypothetical protein